MRIYAKSPRSFPDAIGTPEGHDIVLVGSDTNPDKAYRVDVTHGRCSCPAWTHQKTGNGNRAPCKHLQRLGFVAVGLAGKELQGNPRIMSKAAREQEAALAEALDAPIKELPRLSAGEKAAITKQLLAYVLAD